MMVHRDQDVLHLHCAIAEGDDLVSPWGMNKVSAFEVWSWPCLAG
jgi:hypothetical protein